jgi:hypothetical protein
MRLRFAVYILPTPDNFSRGSGTNCILTSAGNSILRQGCHEITEKSSKTVPPGRTISFPFIVMRVSVRGEDRAERRAQRDKQLIQKL